MSLSLVFPFTMIFNSEKSIQSICGVELSDEENVVEDNEEYFVTESKPKKAKTPAKKKKRSRFAIDTPTKVLENARQLSEDKENIFKHPSGIKKKSPKSSLSKKGKHSKDKENFFEMIFPCTKCKKKFVSQENLERHTLLHKC